VKEKQNMERERKISGKRKKKHPFRLASRGDVAIKGKIRGKREGTGGAGRCQGEDKLKKTIMEKRRDIWY